MRLVDGKVVRYGVRISANNNERYEGEFVDGKREGYGVLVGKYEGEWKDNLYHGRGKLLEEGYEGEFRRGMKHGKGKDGEYEGEFRENMRHGAGRLVDYVGEFRKGKKEPWGKLSLGRNGDEYEGGFKADRFHGRGVYTSSLGGYEGEYCGGERHGEGTRTYSDGSTFSGKFDKGLRTEGMLTSAGKDYVGTFQSDIPHGRGVLVDADKRYDGEWERGLFHGRGTLIFRDGGSYKGSFCDGKKQGEGTRVWVSGNRFEGLWQNDDMVEGTLTYASSPPRHLTATFKNGNAHGQGTETWVGLCPFYRHSPSTTDCCRYRGNYENGKFHGFGELRCVDGRGYKGEWRCGERHGNGEMISCTEKSRGASLYRVLKYTGEWDCGVKQGMGVSEYSDGTLLAGYFDRGHPHGEIKVTFADGSQRTADYDAGRRLKWQHDKPHNAIERCIDGLHRQAAAVAAKKTAERKKREERSRALRLNGNVSEGESQKKAQRAAVIT